MQEIWNSTELMNSVECIGVHSMSIRVRAFVVYRQESRDVTNSYNISLQVVTEVVPLYSVYQAPSHGWNKLQESWLTNAPYLDTKNKYHA